MPKSFHMPAKLKDAELNFSCSPENGLPVARIKTPSDFSLVTGLTSFSMAYNIHIIGYMDPLFTMLCRQGVSIQSVVCLSASVVVSDVFGMLFFNLAVNRLGRRAALLLAALLLVVSAVLATLVKAQSEHSLLWIMGAARAIAGFGAGGGQLYCFSDTSTAPYENKIIGMKRPITISTVSNIAFDTGVVCSGAIPLAVLAILRPDTSVGALRLWRICFGLGIMVLLSVGAHRLRAVDYNLHAEPVMKHRFSYTLPLTKRSYRFIGASLAWFCCNFVTYQFSMIFLTTIVQLSPNNSITENFGYWTVVGFFFLPGWIIGGLLIPCIGPKKTISLGFFSWAIVGFLVAYSLNHIRNNLPWFVILYGVFQTLGRMIREATSVLYASESSTDSLNIHLFGLAAIIGKTGAIFGSQLLVLIQASYSDTLQRQKAAFLIGAGFAGGVCLVFWFFTSGLERQPDGGEEHSIDSLGLCDCESRVSAQSSVERSPNGDVDLQCIGAWIDDGGKYSAIEDWVMSLDSFVGGHVTIRDRQMRLQSVLDLRL